MQSEVLTKLQLTTLTGLQSVWNNAYETALFPAVQAIWHEWDALEDDVSAAELLDLTHRTQRVIMLDAAGQQNNTELLQQIKELCPTTWEKEPYLPHLRKQKAVAEQLIDSVELTPGESLFLETSMPSRGVTEHIMEHCLAHDIFPRVDVQDRDFLRLLLAACTPEQAAAAAGPKAEKRMGSDKLLFPIQELPISDAVKAVADADAVSEQGEAYGKVIAASRKYTQNHDIRYCLTFIPTPKEAEQDDMDYDEYLKLFFELCNQPWSALQAAQANLIQAFNRCQGFHVTNSDGTDIDMSIDGFQFANSVVARNLPGSEIFSAPELDSVNGTIVAKGKFKAPGSTEIIEDMTLTFKDGHLVDYDARMNKDALTKFLDRHPENKRVGELGIGTNPWLQRHVVNGLLVEKISGSFHLALGHCYKNGYLGEEVRMDNGNNDSPDHWDMTTMLKGKDGKMYLTDENGKEHLVQDNGEWLAVPELGLEQEHMDVLNRGWQALREQGKPVPSEWLPLLDERYGTTEKSERIGR